MVEDTQIQTNEDAPYDISNLRCGSDDAFTAIQVEPVFIITFKEDILVSVIDITDMSNVQSVDVFMHEQFGSFDSAVLLVRIDIHILRA